MVYKVMVFLYLVFVGTGIVLCGHIVDEQVAESPKCKKFMKYLASKNQEGLKIWLSQDPAGDLAHSEGMLQFIPCLPYAKEFYKIVEKLEPSEPTEAYTTHIDQPQVPEN
jgi:hypothetical protein